MVRGKIKKWGGKTTKGSVAKMLLVLMPQIEGSESLLANYTGACRFGKKGKIH